MRKPKLSFIQILNMSVGFFGIQTGFALQNANVSRIFEILGAKIENIPILWIAAPVTGLIVQPIIGHFSDKTWTRLGRRRPYFLTGAILASLAMIVMPNSPALWFAALMLWIMDASINISMEPFRAFVGDMLPDEQRTLGFSMQSFFIGLGAVIGSLMPYLFTALGVSNTAAPGVVPDSVKLSFYVGAAFFFGAVAWTVFTTKEYSPEELAAFEDSDYKVEEDSGISNFSKETNRAIVVGLVSFVIGGLLTAWLHQLNVDSKVYVFAVGLIVFALLEFLAVIWLRKKVSNGYVEILVDLNNMPKTMWQLAIVQFFSWFALFSMWIYSTPAIARHVFGATDPTSSLYQAAANWVGVSFAVYNGFAAIFAFFLIWMAKKTNRKITHALALTVGAISLISIFFIHDKYVLLLAFVGIGLVWASILAMPYAILTGALPANKMGIYMGIFNFFIVIPQILAASILGFIVKSIFHDQPIYALMVGGFSFLIAAIAVLFVDDVSAKRLKTA